MRYWVILFLIFTVVSCRDVNKPKKPKDLIGKDVMVEVLTEAYLANAARSVDNRSILAKGVKMDSLIYDKFDIDSLQFVKSNEYYAANMDIYMEIFKKVESNLTSMEKNLDSIRYANPDRNKDAPKEPMTQEVIKDSL